MPAIEAEDKNLKVLPATNLQAEIEQRKKKVRTLMIVNISIFIFSIFLLVLFYYLVSKPENNLVSVLTESGEQAQLEEAMEKETLYMRKIDGQMVSLGQEDNQLMAVMIDNHSDARPHAGIAKALLVFEAEVEGSATRLMAVFAKGQGVKEIGPVRSARPYFIDWARELGALYTHVGGSPDALVKIQKEKIPDMNEFYNGKYFWRGNDKGAPHNVYTSSANLENYITDKDISRIPLIAWNFKDDLPESELATSSVIQIAYRIAGDEVEWRFDKSNNDYERYVGGEPYLDKDGTKVTAKNIAILVAEAHELDEKLRLEMDTIGSGVATICQDGFCKEGSWTKKHAGERTRFFTSEGKEIAFNRGPTWIQAVRPSITVTIDN